MEQHRIGGWIRGAGHEPANGHPILGRPAFKADSGNLTLLTLRLARCDEHPAGAPHKGYTFLAPLDKGGRLDLHRWPSLSERCIVRRFWEREPDRFGHLEPRPAAAGGVNWCFVYGAGHDVGPGDRFHNQTFALGDDISIRIGDDDLKAFRITGLQKACLR